VIGRRGQTCHRDPVAKEFLIRNCKNAFLYVNSKPIGGKSGKKFV
jgi:hypothetical protein